MDEKNELLNGVNNDDNMKKYLIIGGVVFVLFVVGIVVAKLLFSSPKEETKVILPPETTTKPQKSETELFNSIPVEDNNKVDNKKESTKNSFEKPVTQNMNSIVENNKPVEQNSKIELQQPKVEKTPEPVYKPKAKVQTQQSKLLSISSNKNYYIQVAAVTRGEPSEKFLKLIVKNGFEYKIITVSVKNKTIKRVLVGPFTRNEAKKSLPVVKEKITSSAFIKKLK